MVNLTLLKQMRKENRYSCRQIAEILGFSSASAYWKIEQGVSPIKCDQLSMLAKLYNRPISDFFVCDHEVDDV